MSFSANSVMSYEEFSDVMLNAINENLPTERKLTIRKVNKNNSTQKDGIVFSDMESFLISPTFYMDDFYANYLKSEFPIDDFALEISDFYKRDYDPTPLELLDIESIDDIKNRLALKVVNTELNKSLLEEIPSIPFLDLSIVFLILNIEGDGNVSSTILTNELLKDFDITIDELYEIALSNTEDLLGVKITDMASLLIDMLTSAPFNPERDNAEELEKIIEEIHKDQEKINMYVMTNRTGFNGATTMLMSPLKNFACDLEKDIYIIPASIHEVILIPVTSEISLDSLLRIVEDVNQRELKKSEILSNNVYYYNYEACTLSVAEESNFQL